MARRAFLIAVRACPRYTRFRACLRFELRNRLSADCLLAKLDPPNQITLRAIVQQLDRFVKLLFVQQNTPIRSVERSPGFCYLDE